MASQGSKSKPEVSAWARLLVIAYASGLVVLGVYPIQKEYGSFWRFVEVEIVGNRLNVSTLTSSGDSLVKKLPKHRRAEERRRESHAGFSWLSQTFSKIKAYAVNDSPKKRVNSSQNSARARISWPKIRAPKAFQSPESPTRSANAKKRASRETTEPSSRSSQGELRFDENQGGEDDLGSEDRGRLDNLLETLD